MKEDNLLSEKDKQRLEYLKSLPPNRHEFEKDGQPIYVDISPKEPQKLQP